MDFLNQYKNLQKIGSSNNSVIYNADNKEALKVLIHDSEGNHTQQCQHLKNEAKILRNIEHPNIVSVNTYKQSVAHKSQQFCCMSLELADMDFFGLIEQTFPKKVEVTVIRELFKQICSGIQTLHETNICHNDLKLENVLLFLQEEEGTEMVSAVPKIADFGFARVQNTQFKLTPQQINEKWNNRSNCALAPEILRFKKYYKEGKMEKIQQGFDEKKAEMFALGVMLFSALFLRSPIQSDTAHSADLYYRFLFARDAKKFWEIKDFQYELKRISGEQGSDLENLKDLLVSLLSVDCNERPTIQQVLKHKWFQN